MFFHQVFNSSVLVLHDGSDLLHQKLVFVPASHYLFLLDHLLAAHRRSKTAVGSIRLQERRVEAAFKLVFLNFGSQSKVAPFATLVLFLLALNRLLRALQTAFFDRTLRRGLPV